MYIPLDPSILHMGMYNRKKIYLIDGLKETPASIIATLFVTFKKYRQPKCLSTGKLIKFSFFSILNMFL